MDINNKNIILTGASSGIGKEILKLLLKYKDVKIIAVARDVSNIPPVENTVYPFSADLTKKEEIDKLFSFSQKTYVYTDIFIANAGFGYMEIIKNTDWQHIEDIFSLNVISHIYALENLNAEKGPARKAFVSMSSGAGLVPLPYYSLYCSTKSAIHFFFETYRYEKPDNLQISVVYPVAVKTNFFDKASGKKKTPLPSPHKKPEKVARRIIRGIEKDKKKIYQSLMFRLTYPLGRAFPFLLKIFSKKEQNKIKNWV